MSGEIQDLGDIDGSHTRCLGGGWQSVGMFGASLAAYVVLWAERGGVNFACVPVLLRSPCIIFAPASMRQMFFAAHLLLRHSRLECLLGSKVFSMVVSVTTAVTLSFVYLTGSMAIQSSLLVTIITSLHLHGIWCVRGRPLFRIGPLVITERVLDFLSLIMLHSTSSVPSIISLGAPIITFFISSTMIGADWVKRSSILFSKRVVVNDSIVKMLRGDHGSEVEVNISEEEISRLMDLGFSRELCLDAIKRSKGNLEAACDLLLGE